MLIPRDYLFTPKNQNKSFSNTALFSNKENEKCNESGNRKIKHDKKEQPSVFFCQVTK